MEVAAGDTRATAHDSSGMYLLRLLHSSPKSCARGNQGMVSRMERFSRRSLCLDSRCLGAASLERSSEFSDVARQKGIALLRLLKNEGADLTGLSDNGVVNLGDATLERRRIGIAGDPVDSQLSPACSRGFASRIFAIKKEVVPFRNSYYAGQSPGFGLSSSGNSHTLGAETCGSSTRSANSETSLMSASTWFTMAAGPAGQRWQCGCCNEELDTHSDQEAAVSPQNFHPLVTYLFDMAGTGALERGAGKSNGRPHDLLSFFQMNNSHGDRIGSGHFRSVNHASKLRSLDEPPHPLTKLEEAKTTSLGGNKTNRFQRRHSHKSEDKEEGKFASPLFMRPPDPSAVPIPEWF